MTKPIGWFSRRYKTGERHLAAQRAKESRIGRWEETMRRNTEAHANRTPQQQLDVLDGRLGKGMGAKRERKALEAKLES